MRLSLPAVLPVSGSYGCVTLAIALMSVFHLSSSHLTRSCIGSFARFIPTCSREFRINFIESVTSFAHGWVFVLEKTAKKKKKKKGCTSASVTVALAARPQRFLSFFFPHLSGALKEG